MENNDFNTVIKSAIALRNFANDINVSNEEITKEDERIKKMLEEASAMLSPYSNVKEVWVNDKNQFLEFGKKLIEAIKELSTKFKNKDTSGITDIWESLFEGSDDYKVLINKMANIGEIIFTDDKLSAWQKIWKNIKEHIKNVVSLTETYNVKLRTMEQLNPGEIDELTKAILKNIPLDFTEEEALEYEKEYMQAYNELKEEASHKKNVWDKFLDILAGGVQETPEHRVQMRRWMDNGIIGTEN